MTRWPCTTQSVLAAAEPFDFDSWLLFLEAAAEVGAISESGWRVANVLVALADDEGAVAPDHLLKFIEEDGGGPLTAIDGAKELAAVNLLHDFGERLVAVLPAIIVRT